MNFRFDNIYYTTNEDGLMNIVFEDLNADAMLYFDGGRFSFIDTSINKASYNCLDVVKGNLLQIKETDDLDYILQTDKGVIFKIFFFPNDSYLNGVEQVLKVYTSKDDLYAGLLLEMDVSKDAVIY